jgi:hypothetical protein
MHPFYQKQSTSWNLYSSMHCLALPKTKKSVLKVIENINTSVLNQLFLKFGISYIWNLIIYLNHQISKRISRVKSHQQRSLGAQTYIFSKSVKRSWNNIFNKHIFNKFVKQIYNFGIAYLTNIFSTCTKDNFVCKTFIQKLFKINSNTCLKDT